MKIIDVGFNRGEFTKSIATDIEFVSAIEANPMFKTGGVQLLDELFGEDYYNYWSNAAGADTGKTVELHVGDDDLISTCSTEFRDRDKYKVRYSHVMQVDTVTLDTVIETDGVPDLIKIDVEGYESSVLAGLKTPVDWILFEFSGEMPTNILSCRYLINSIGNYEYGYVINPPERYGQFIEAPSDFTKTKLEDVLIPLCVHDPSIWGMVWARRINSI